MWLKTYMFVFNKIFPTGNRAQAHHLSRSTCHPRSISKVGAALLLSGFVSRLVRAKRISSCPKRVCRHEPWPKEPMENCYATLSEHPRVLIVGINFQEKMVSNKIALIKRVLDIGFPNL